MRCSANFSVASAIAPILKRPREKWDFLITNASRTTRLVVQLSYVGMSAVVFWLLMAYNQDRFGNEWYMHAALSIVILAFFTLFFFWLVPRTSLALLARRTTRLSKLGLLINYFSLLLVLQILIGIWKDRAFMLATLFVVSWIAFYLFLSFLYPVWCAMGETAIKEDKGFDPTANQGRRARRD